MNQKNEEQDLNTNISAYTTFKSKDILYLLEDYIALDEKTDIQDFLTELFTKFSINPKLKNSELRAWAKAQRLEPKELSFLITESLGQDFAKNFDEYLTNIYDMGEFKPSKVNLNPLNEKEFSDEIDDNSKKENNYKKAKEYVIEMANDDYDAGQPFSRDDFNEFKSILKDDNIKVSNKECEKLFDYYFECYDDAREENDEEEF